MGRGHAGRERVGRIHRGAAADDDIVDAPLVAPLVEVVVASERRLLPVAEHHRHQVARHLGEPAVAATGSLNESALRATRPSRKPSSRMP